ncbi:MAG: hypothetical protein DYG92_14035, partial [Leptolyngbya sp. PLA1]|nr:hypothetical protein [Leptolyngbya sp. PLA1]
MPMHSWGVWLVGLVSAGVAAGALAGWLTRADPAAAARELDRRLSLHDLLSSTLELRNSDSPQTALLVARSERVAAAVRPRAVLPLAPAMRTPWWGWLGPVLALGLVVGLWLPARAPSGRTLPPAAPAQLTREAVDVVREAMAAMAESAAPQPDPGGAPPGEWQREVERELASGGRSEIETRALAAQAAQAAADSLDESARRATERADSLAERLANAAAASPGVLGGQGQAGEAGRAAPESAGPGKALQDAIKEGNLSDAAAALAEARRRLAEMSPQERESLAQELERWASDVSRGGTPEPGRVLEQPSGVTPGDGPRPPTSEEKAARGGGAPEREPGAKPPADDSEPVGRDSEIADPLAEQLRDAAREVRGEADPTPQDQQEQESRTPRDAPRRAGDQPPPSPDSSERDDPQRSPDAEPQGAKEGSQSGRPEPGPDQRAPENRPTKTGANDSGAARDTPRDAAPSQSSRGEPQPGQPGAGTQKPGDRREVEVPPAPSQQPGSGTPPKPGDTSAPRPAANPNDGPGRAPSREPGRGQPGAAPAGAMGEKPVARSETEQQPPGGLEGLERTLRESERLRERGERDAARARHLRERARELLTPGAGEPRGVANDGPAGDGGAGEAREPRESPGIHDEPDSRGAEVFPPVDDRLDLRPREDAEGPLTPLAEWDRAPGDGSPAPAGSALAGRMRAAAGSAERAIDD